MQYTEAKPFSLSSIVFSTRIPRLHGKILCITTLKYNKKAVQINRGFKKNACKMSKISSVFKTDQTVSLSGCGIQNMSENSATLPCCWYVNKSVLAVIRVFTVSLKG